MMILFVGVTFHHAASGMQVVLEDYVHSEAAKIARDHRCQVRCASRSRSPAFSPILKIAFGG